MEVKIEVRCSEHDLVLDVVTETVARGEWLTPRGLVDVTVDVGQCRECLQERSE